MADDHYTRVFVRFSLIWVNRIHLVG